MLAVDRCQFDHFRRPVLAQALDQVAVKDEQGDLPHPLADVLHLVIKLGFPLSDRRIAVQVEVQQLTLDVALTPNDLGLPVVADAVAAQDRRPQDALVVGSAGGKDGRDQLGVLLGPGLNVDVQDLTNLLLGQRHPWATRLADRPPERGQRIGPSVDQPHSGLPLPWLPMRRQLPAANCLATLAASSRLRMPSCSAANLAASSRDVRPSIQRTHGGSPGRGDGKTGIQYPPEVWTGEAGRGWPWTLYRGRSCRMAAASASRASERDGNGCRVTLATSSHHPCRAAWLASRRTQRP